MTNRDALILALRAMGPDEKTSYDALCESPWEDFATPESVVAYGVACPHRQGEPDLPCAELTWPWSTLTVCGPCIESWLDEEADDDG